MMKCPECNGKGSITLFFSKKPCLRCSGFGEVKTEEEEKRDQDTIIAEYDSANPDNEKEVD